MDKQPHNKTEKYNKEMLCGNENNEKTYHQICQSLIIHSPVTDH
ncbi:hypothetical protein EPIR_3532 [Erwinia piriflorinigrans CFBP 5888]|uniref:Uncharacterized protein n=1 Tax=Erwinia piriflorinigrans CFBP 5888 TaxID=1161919 RepID=V5ZC90_9GAMM|nr:hypothetical protein EPIR_3532 [Erwinia piriflorinigrans CFBP 5888]